jgi:ATP-dependent RNA helicase DDX27
MKILFGLNNLQAAELHGNLTQLQRIQSLESFRDGHVEFLLATDVAARGLDISAVETVLNFQMPVSYDRYVHRVGRTARFDRSGCAVTLVAEKERKMVKMVMKNLKPGQVVKQRVLPASVLEKYRKMIADAEDKIQTIMQEEKEEKAVRQYSL